MKNYSKVSKLGFILQIVAMLISAINILYSGKNSTSIAFFCCMISIFGLTIVIAEASKKNVEKNNKN